MQPMNIQTSEILHQQSNCCYIKKKCVQEKWIYLRNLTHRLVEHRYFEWFIIISILVSSITLVS